MSEAASTIISSMLKEKGLLWTIERVLWFIEMSLKAKFTMFFLPPTKWPLSVDRYLLWHSRGFDRPYTYQGSFRSRINPTALFGHFMNVTTAIPGDIAEFGVYRGDTLIAWAKNLKLMEVENKTIYGFDSFEGYPDVSAVDASGKWHTTHRGGLNTTSMELVRDRCDSAGVGDIIELIQGYFAETTKNHADLRFSQVYINCDLYESYMDALKYVYPRLTPGGVIVFDEYGDPRWPGGTKATDDFFRDKPEKILLCDVPRHTDKQAPAYVVKR